VANEKAEEPGAAKETTGSRSDAERRYQLYVRVPKTEDDSLLDVQTFLQDLADWLSNTEHEIEVLPYDDTTEAYIAKPAGDRTSPLYPLYVCHNKF
jgi:hypothetical protein